MKNVLGGLLVGAAGYLAGVIVVSASWTRGMGEQKAISMDTIHGYLSWGFLGHAFRAPLSLLCGVAFLIIGFLLFRSGSKMSRFMPVIIGLVVIELVLLVGIAFGFHALGKQMKRDYEQLKSR